MEEPACQVASRRRLTWLVLIPFLIIAGCSSDNERLADLSRQSLDRQAEQNRLVEANNRQVIDAYQKLVEAEAQARRDSSQLQQQMQSERSRISEQRDAIEQERREIANERNRDPIIAESIQAAVGVLVAVLPLAVAVYLLRGLFHRSDEEAMADVLVEELLSQQLFLAGSEGLCLQTGADVESLSSGANSSNPRLPDPRLTASRSQTQAAQHVVVHVEGSNDTEFLRRISSVLHKRDPMVPDLAVFEAEGQIAFLAATLSPCFQGRRTQASFADFYLYDRELPPLTDERIRLVDRLNEGSRLPRGADVASGPSRITCIPMPSVKPSVPRSHSAISTTWPMSLPK